MGLVGRQCGERGGVSGRSLSGDNLQISSTLPLSFFATNVSPECFSRLPCARPCFFSCGSDISGDSQLRSTRPKPASLRDRVLAPIAVPFLSTEQSLGAYEVGVVMRPNRSRKSLVLSLAPLSLERKGGRSFGESYACLISPGSNSS